MEGWSKSGQGSNQRAWENGLEVKGAFKQYPGGTKVDGTAGGGLASLGWGCRWVWWRMSVPGAGEI